MAVSPHINNIDFSVQRGKSSPIVEPDPEPLTSRSRAGCAKVTLPESSKAFIFFLICATLLPHAHPLPPFCGYTRRIQFHKAECGGRGRQVKELIPVIGIEFEDKISVRRLI